VNIIHDKLKVHSLTGRITIELMHKAFKAVKKNRGAAGIDKVSIEMYKTNLHENLLSLMKELKQGNYQPIPLKRVYIPKGDGKLRPLGIPTVKCRVAQEAVRQLINPTFEARFHNDSFGFRPGRNCHQAVERVMHYAGQDYKFVVDVDIRGFFDNIPHELIMESIAARISDGNILSLLGKFLKSGVMEEGKLRSTTKGTPQGGVISPLLSNIVLNHLDGFLTAKGFRFVRYADDFVILCKTQTEAERALGLTQEFLMEMELQTSPEKTKICHCKDGFNFLGFTISSYGVTIRDKSKEKFKSTIKEITTRSHNLDREVVNRLNQVIRGTVNYFCTNFSAVKEQFKILDCWIRKRIRCMKYKRIWLTDNPRLRNKHIGKMGVLSCLDLCKARQRC
jgi:RNA-directed DNA polymerase